MTKEDTFETNNSGKNRTSIEVAFELSKGNEKLFRQRKKMKKFSINRRKSSGCLSLAHTHTPMHPCTHKCAHTYSCMHTRTHTHACAHAHIHTQ